MKYLKRFNESSIYETVWKKYLPESVEIVSGENTHKFTIGNIMNNSDMVQITYTNSEWGAANTLEFDIYFIQNGKFKIDVDITFGDSVMSEFSITSPNKVSVIQYTSKGSKFAHNNIFALSDDTIENLVKFFNKFDGIKISSNDLNFLDIRDNYNPN